MAKLYTKCDEIPLCKFIEAYNGNLKALVISGMPSDKELQDVASSLMQEYASIIGNNNLSFEISRKNNLINSNIKLTLLDVGENLIEMKAYKDASDVLSYVGIKIGKDYSDNSIKKIFGLIESNRAYIKMRVEMAKRNEQQRLKTIQPKSIDFTRERMIVSTHFKMHIDPMKYTASEYGNVVKIMLDELKEIKNYGKRS